MRNTVDYSKLQGEEKQKKALEDICDYLGNEKFDSMNAKFLEAGAIDPGQFEFICMVGGIEGYPVEAWYMSLYGDNEDKII